MDDKLRDAIGSAVNSAVQHALLDKFAKAWVHNEMYTALNNHVEESLRIEIISFDNEKNSLIIKVQLRRTK